MEFGFSVALIICACALLKYVQARARNKWNQNGQELERRLDEMERRLSDIQEVVLAIDEKLERQERLRV